MAADPLAAARVESIGWRRLQLWGRAGDEGVRLVVLAGGARVAVWCAADDPAAVVLAAASGVAGLPPPWECEVRLGGRRVGAWEGVREAGLAGDAARVEVCARPAPASDADCDETVRERMMAWAAAGGASFRGLVRRDGRSGGLVTARGFGPGEAVLSVPLELVLTAEAAAASPVGRAMARHLPAGAPEGRRSVLLAVCMLEEMRNERSFWRPYLDVLRRAAPPGTFPGEVPRPGVLRGTATEAHAAAASDRAYLGLARAVPGFSAAYSAAQFLWARRLARARQFGISRGADLPRTSGLVPLADLLPHAHGRRFRYGWFDDVDAFEVRARDGAVPEGTPVAISFGHKSQARWLMNYGRVPPDNFLRNTALFEGEGNAGGGGAPLSLGAEDAVAMVLAADDCSFRAAVAAGDAAGARAALRGAAAWLRGVPRGGPRGSLEEDSDVLAGRTRERRHAALLAASPLDPLAAHLVAEYDDPASDALGRGCFEARRAEHEVLRVTAECAAAIEAGLDALQAGPGGLDRAGVARLCRGRVDQGVRRVLAVAGTASDKDTRHASETLGTIVAEAVGSLSGLQP